MLKEIMGEPLIIVGGGGSGKSEKKSVSGPSQEKNCKCQGAGKIIL